MSDGDDASSVLSSPPESPRMSRAMRPEEPVLGREDSELQELEKQEKELEQAVHILNRKREVDRGRIACGLPPIYNLGLSQEEDKKKKKELTDQERNRKPAAPKEYHGESIEKLHEFIRGCENTFEIMPLTYEKESHRVLWATTFLGGTPAKRWADAKTSLQELTWEIFTAFLHNLIQTPQARRRETSFKWFELQQGTRSVQEYAATLAEYESELEGIPEGVRMDKFVQGLKIPLRNKLTEATIIPVTIEEAIAIASQFEYNWKNHRNNIERRSTGRAASTATQLLNKSAAATISRTVMWERGICTTRGPRGQQARQRNRKDQHSPYLITNAILHNTVHTHSACTRDTQVIRLEKQALDTTKTIVSYRKVNRRKALQDRKQVL
ncbi:hypothetical protein ACHAP3_003298 [Botrytis cinerea]